MLLPEEFITYTRSLFGEERWQRYLSAFNEPAPVSIRLNPFKSSKVQEFKGSCAPVGAQASKLGADFQFSIFNFPFSITQPVPWCRHAHYLTGERPNFTLDPLFHAGAYYVQEASSMFLDHVLTNLPPLWGIRGGLVLDLCAAPGGKSTLLRAALPDDVTLYSNEPDRHRANILMENMQKQGHPNVIVTNNYPSDYVKAGMTFDLILADVPCSGEGMFRKDPGTIAEWSMQNVMKCQSLQRSIIEEIWQCLNPGGVLIYSTCTFNTRENEENIQWIVDNLGAEVLPVCVESEWNITGSLLKDFSHPVYRFIPGITKGEGLFMAVLRKTGDGNADVEAQRERAAGSKRSMAQRASLLRVLSTGNPEPVVKGKKIIPPYAEALLVSTPKAKYPRAELSRDEALRYLHHETIVLSPDIPRGYVIVTYSGLPLGFVNNIGSRANNLYPKEWKIRNL